MTAAAQSELIALINAIAADDTPSAARLLRESPAVAQQSVQVGATRTTAVDFYLDGIGHYVYRGDTALHIAGAAYRVGIARALVAAGAAIGAQNRRGATALHYAADGRPGSANWDPVAQADTITYLIGAGADPNALDRSGVAPLHRAVRTRSAAAVAALLTGGADPQLANRNGSTPLALARRTTGRGGSGSPAAKAQQELIVDLLS